MGSWKKFIMGEKMPDKNDPQYKERYERDVASGRKFAKWLKIDKAAGYAQCFALRRPKLFLALVFGVVIGCFSINIYHLVKMCNRPNTEAASTVSQHQEQVLKEKREFKIHKLNDTTTGHKEQD